MGNIRKRYLAAGKTLPKVGKEYSKSCPDTNELMILKSETLKSNQEKEEPTVKKRKLSSKERKRLEKVVERRQKKKQREDLFVSLQNHQLDSSQLEQIQSSCQLGVKTPAKSNSASKSSKWEMGETHEDDFESSSCSENENLREDKAVVYSSHALSSQNSSCSKISRNESQPATKTSLITLKESRVTLNTTNNSNSTTNNTDSTTNTTNNTRKAFYVNVKRNEAIQAARLSLPILAEEQSIMETIFAHDITILCGETGSGKTTQVPQFLYEAGFGHPTSPQPGLIGITEPRRVAALSMAARVGQELGLLRGEVAYQIRFEGDFSERSVVKFMTDGILLKEIETDFSLSKYSAVIVDEAHERSVNTDILIGLLSRIVPLRRKLFESAKVNPATSKPYYPLKFIIMSATLRVQDFLANQRLFSSPPPVLKIDARQHPVTIHFNRKTPRVDYISEAVKKVSKIHRKLPPGGILVFVTGQKEVSDMCRKLSKMFPNSTNSNSFSASRAPRFPSQKQMLANSHQDSDKDSDKDFDQDFDENCDQDFDQDSDENSDQDSDRADDRTPTQYSNYGPLHILPFYSLLSSKEQLKVFETPPETSRLCVIATNVAETSLTIPNIKYVVDCGKVKQNIFDKTTHISHFNINWISKSSAHQRAGRAGRTGPGHVYRLYSSAVFEHQFAEFSAPDLLNVPMEGLYLQMKCMGIDRVLNFPFPSAPDFELLRGAEKLLRNLGALDGDAKKVTALGKIMAKFPLAPRFSRMIVAAINSDCLAYIVALVAALTVQDVFILDDEANFTAGNKEDDTEECSTRFEEKNRKRFRLFQKWYSSNLISSDLLAILKAVGAFEYSGGTQEFCQENYLRFKSMVEIRKLRKQITHIICSIEPAADLCLDPKMKPPSGEQEIRILQIVVSSFGDQICKSREDSDGNPSKQSGKASGKLLNWKPYEPQKQQLENQDFFIHPSSICFSHPPKFIFYTQVRSTSRNYMHLCSEIPPQWLSLLLPQMCRFSGPLESEAPLWDPAEDALKCRMSVSFSPKSWHLAPQISNYPQVVEKYKWFGRYFLEGKIFHDLEKFTPHFLTSPQMMTKSVTHQRSFVFLQLLIDEKISSRNQLLQKWKSESVKNLENVSRPKFLLAAYLLWFPQHLHQEIISSWPPKN